MDFSSLLGGGGSGSGVGPASSAQASNTFGGGDPGKWIAIAAVSFVGLVALVLISKS